MDRQGGRRFSVVLHGTELGVASMGWWQYIKSRLGKGWFAKPGKRSTSKDLSVGSRGEHLAADFLRNRGMRIVHHGYRSPWGEIDLIAIDRVAKERLVVFVEVKTWSRPATGGPADAVDRRKQEKLTRLALEFLKRHRLLESRARFDVVEVVLNPLTIRHYPNAFEAVGEGQWFA